jgi:hypothetical protein
LLKPLCGIDAVINVSTEFGTQRQILQNSEMVTFTLAVM